MDFRLLGPLEVRDGERVVAVAGTKQLALLAMLLLDRGRVVSRDRLIEALWPDSAPGAAGRALDHQVSRLRKALAPADPIVTRGGGYALDVEPAEVDVDRFERLAEQGRHAQESGAPDRAAADLREALGLWRGEALGELAYEPFARVEAERLEELRLATTEALVDAELALGRHATVVSEVESLVARHPLRERLRGQLMLALYRSGRQADALQAYADARRRLVDELGIEPGPELQGLQRAILRQAPELELAAPAQGRLPKRRRAALAAAGLAVAAGAAAAGLVLATGGTPSSSATALAGPDSVTLVRPSDGRIEARADVPDAARLVFGEGALWAASTDGRVTRVDPASGKLGDPLGTGASPGGLAAGLGSVWSTDARSATLLRIDPELGVVAERIALPTARVSPATETYEVAVGAGSVWVAHGGLSRSSFVERLSPDGRVERRIAIPQLGAYELAFGDGSLWVGGGDGGWLWRIDPRTNSIAARLHLEATICCLAAGGGFLWAATLEKRDVWQIAPDGTPVTSVRLPQAARGLAYGAGAVWAADGTGGLVRIDPATASTTTYRTGHLVDAVAAGGGSVALSIGQTPADATAGLGSRTARVLVTDSWVDSTDPVVLSRFNAGLLQLDYATCAKLLNYPDAAGAAGRRLVPEVAAAWPDVSDGGRTYAFRIRPGYRFSPPSNAPVTAEAFRHAIERVLSPALGSHAPGAKVMLDIVGAAAYRAGRTAHLAGVTARGDTLVIRLVRPAPDLPLRLALPFFCAVPPDTPSIPDGVPRPIASAGPYYLAARTGDVAVLRRNPNYRGPRPHRLDAIVYRIGVGAGEAAAAIRRGQGDYVSEFDPALAAAPRARYPGTDFLALNSGRGLFANPRLRSAVADAVDRRALAAARPDLAIPAAHVLSPELPGATDAPVFPLRADLDAARRLAGGVRRTATLGGCNHDPHCEPLVATVRRDLAAIGIAVSEHAGRGPVDILLAQTDWGPFDPVQELASLPYLPAAYRLRLDRIARLRSPAREAAAGAFALELDRRALYVSYADAAIPEVVSPRLGCRIHAAAYPGLDLAALCLRGH